MAKRENFIIQYSEKQIVKHAWNASIRETEKIIGQIAKEEQTIYNLTDSKSVKKGFGHVQGYRTWTGENGKSVTFVINKQ